MSLSVDVTAIRGGCYYDSTALLSISSEYIEIVKDDTIFENLQEVGDVNVLGSDEWNLNNVSLPAGVVITPLRDKFIKVAIKQGGVIIHNK